jgi:hypothetical protein
MRPTLKVSVESHRSDSLATGSVTFEETGVVYDYVSDVPLPQLIHCVTSIRNNVEHYLQPKASDVQRKGCLERIATAGWMLLQSLLGTVSLGQDDDPVHKETIIAWLSGSGGLVIFNSITIDAPWSFIYLSDDPAIDPDHFLGCRHVVIQQFQMLGRLSPPVWPARKILAVHGNDIKMVEETDHIRQHAATNVIDCRTLPPDINTSITDCRRAFTDAWRQFSPSVFHVASHLRPGPQQIGGGAGSPFDADFDVYHKSKLSVGHVLKTMAERRRALELGFLNVCDLGKGASMTDGGSARSLSSWLGCSIWVDTLLTNDISSTFADTFYKLYLSGSSALEAFSAAKDALGKSEPNVITALSYRFAFRYTKLLGLAA